MRLINSGLQYCDKSGFAEVRTMIRLKYGNTNTFFIHGDNAGLLFDTDYAGTLSAFYKAIKQNCIAVKDIGYILASHYHPDHMGLISELMKQSVKLLVVDVQKGFLHYSDGIFARDGFSYSPINELSATVISCEESRALLSCMGIHGSCQEIIGFVIINITMKKLETSRRIIIIISSAISLALQVAAYGFLWFRFYKVMVAKEFWIKGDILMISIYAVLLLFFSRMYGGTRIGYLKAWEVFFSEIFAVFCVNVITYAIISLMSAKLVPPQYMLMLMGADIVWAGIWTASTNGLYSMLFPPRDMLLVSGNRSNEDILAKFASRPDKYNICKCINISEGVDAVIEEFKERYDAMVIWDIPMAERNKLLKYCYGNGVRVYLMPKIPDVLIKGMTEMHIFDTPMYLTREYSLTIEQRIGKRCMDLICSILLMIIASPFMLLTAIAIKLYDHGPVIYKQVRLTRDRKEFYVYKVECERYKWKHN